MMMARFCVCCDAEVEMTPFSNETHQVTFREYSREVAELSGFRCSTCGEVEYDSASAQRYVDAGDSLVLESRRAIGEELRNIRKRLRINQLDASKLTGGGHNAFSRYETGKVIPTPAVVNLFRVLDRHPEEIRQLKRA
jgi:HTH-type transcriptional regulator/antitoxin MqsA